MYLNKLFILKKLQQANTAFGPPFRLGSGKFMVSPQRSLRRPTFGGAQSYIFGFRPVNGPIIDLDKTVISLRRACNVIQLIIRSNGHLLFVNTNPKYNKIIQQTAKYTNQSYINHKWIGGFLTNWNHMRNVQQQFHAATRFSKSSASSFARSARPTKEAETIIKKTECTHYVRPDRRREGRPKGGGPRPLLYRSGGILAREPGGLIPGGLLRRLPMVGPSSPPVVNLWWGDEGAGTIYKPEPRLLLDRRSRLRVPKGGGSLIVNNPRYKKMQKCFEGATWPDYDRGYLPHRSPRLARPFGPPPLSAGHEEVGRPKGGRALASLKTLATARSFVGRDHKFTGGAADCVIIFNASQNSTAIYEAHLNQIPIISIVDSNIPNELYNLITYPIPANYDSVQFIYLFCNCILAVATHRLAS